MTLVMLFVGAAVAFVVGLAFDGLLFGFTLLLCFVAGCFAARWPDTRSRHR